MHLSSRNPVIPISKRKLEVLVVAAGPPRLFLFLVLELIGQPIKALVEAVTAGGTGGLDVPVAVTERV